MMTPLVTYSQRVTHRLGSRISVFFLQLPPTKIRIKNLRKNKFVLATGLILSSPRNLLTKMKKSPRFLIPKGHLTDSKWISKWIFRILEVLKECLRVS
jgi:hypothetical protein